MRSMFVLSLLISLPVFAGDSLDQETAVTAPTCPNARKLKNLCMTVDGRTRVPNPSGRYRFVYQKKLLEAACVDLDKDDEETTKRKMQILWEQHQGQLICNSLQFDVIDGSVVKYAAHTLFDEFLHDMVKWEIDLNKPDAQDGRNVLDYLKDRIERANPESEIRNKMQEYYDLLSKAGARLSSER